VFDIGFSELVVIGLVALIVIGPERLPGVARTVGHLIGRLQRYVADVKADINREVELDEFRKMRDTVQDAASSIETWCKLVICVRASICEAPEQSFITWRGIMVPIWRESAAICSL